MMLTSIENLITVGFLFICVQVELRLNIACVISVSTHSFYDLPWPLDGGGGLRRVCALLTYELPPFLKFNFSNLPLPHS